MGSHMVSQQSTSPYSVQQLMSRILTYNGKPDVTANFADKLASCTEDMQ